MDSLHLPRWLEALLAEKFFNACIIHEDEKKNEKNIFCLDCCESICPHCLTPHRSHRLLQIRRYVYHDVIRLGDAEKLMDCASVQSYTTNSAKVVFINQRPRTRPARCLSNTCITCGRGLQDPYFFCSLSCKLQHILRTEGEISEHLYECEVLTLPEPVFDDGTTTPDSVLEPAVSLRTTSASSGSGCGGGGGVNCRALACTATTEVVRKKRSSMSAYRAACRPVFSPASEANRRKGTPQRSPLY
ncbi:hypothetical protein RJ640_006777 [Escallonia rubra]|uniref:B box-type domain-containing protein n=1 Tax=Escallonia rubra TaxID=112253 RepID=A0AA88QZE2_9ASTE|nr:hypothetical protein RJ640_006777 [Escallonia rubra]